jgi:hypothetical protein
VNRESVLGLQGTCPDVGGCGLIDGQEKNARFRGRDSFPRSSVGMPSSTLRVAGVGPEEGPRSGQDGIPTRSVGTSFVETFVRHSLSEDQQPRLEASGGKV